MRGRPALPTGSLQPAALRVSLVAPVPGAGTTAANVSSSPMLAPLLRMVWGRAKVRGIVLLSCYLICALCREMSSGATSRQISMDSGRILISLLMGDLWGGVSHYHLLLAIVQLNITVDNPVVKYQKIPCPGQLKSNYGGCKCAKGAQSRVRRGIMDV